MNYYASSFGYPECRLPKRKRTKNRNSTIREIVQVISLSGVRNRLSDQVWSMTSESRGFILRSLWKHCDSEERFSVDVVYIFARGVLNVRGARQFLKKWVAQGLLFWVLEFRASLAEEIACFEITNYWFNIVIGCVSARLRDSWVVRMHLLIK